MINVNRLLKSPLRNLIKIQIFSSNGRCISTTANLFNEKESEKNESNPIRKTFNIIGNDISRLITYFKSSKKSDINDGKQESEIDTDMFQTHCDVLVIGGGGIGSSVAFWLKKKARNGLNVVVVEKDCTYKKVSAVQSFRGLNQYFSLPENIQMAKYGADFIRDAKEHLGNVNLKFTPYGSLVLASEEEAEVLIKNSKIQNEMGIRSELLPPDKLAMRFPWLNTEGIALGWHGLEREGWFDPMALLLGFKLKAHEYGAHFVEAEVIDFEFQQHSDVLVANHAAEDSYIGLDKAVLQMPNGERRTVKFAICIIAAGSSSKHVGNLAKIGKGPGLLSIPLPVERKTRYSYVLDSPNQGITTCTTPLTIDPMKTYYKHDGLTGHYICGCNINIEYESSSDSLQQEVLDNHVLPNLSKRIKNFKYSKVNQKTTNSYEFNTFDDNGIVGTHPYYNNLYLAFGFDGQGIQQAVAVGRGISELIIDGRYRCIDLTRLGFDRLIVDQPLMEPCII